jgi:hypothetical protein
MSADRPEHEELAEIVRNFPDYSEYKERWENALIELEAHLAEKHSLKSLLSKALDAYLKGPKEPHVVVWVKVEKNMDAGLLVMGKRSFEPTAKQYFMGLAKVANVLLNPRGWQLEHARSLSHSGVAGRGSFFCNAAFELSMI